MSKYDGQIAVIPLGSAGIYTDGPQTSIPPTALIRAINCTYYNNILQKAYGSRIWNSQPLPSGVVQGLEMYPDAQSQNQRIYTMLVDGSVYRFKNFFTNEEITPTGSAPTNLNTNNYTCMVVGGNELVNNPKKLFLFSGYDPVQVITGDGVTRSNISLPALDWSGTQQPFGGVMHRGRLFAWGNDNSPHQLYVSSATNHEDFTTTPLNFNVYPGEYDGVVCCKVFRGVLYIFKYPLGIYYLNDTNADSSMWYIQKFSDDFGACSPQSAETVNDDLLVANNYGSLSSLKASLIFGNFMASDVFHMIGCFRFAQEEIRADVINKRALIYYGKKRQLFMSYQSHVDKFYDRMAMIDYKNQQLPPKAAFIDKDQPNCLFNVRDQFKVPKPFYGANDGNIYEMDVADHWVGNQTDRRAYKFDAQTPHMDFSLGSSILGDQVKLFDFLVIEYEATGDWNVNIEVYIDSRFAGLYTCNLSSRSDLDEFPLGDSVVDGLTPFYRKFPIYGEGKCISLRFYNAEVGQDVRLVKARIYYRMSGQQASVG